MGTRNECKIIKHDEKGIWKIVDFDKNECLRISSQFFDETLPDGRRYWKKCGFDGEVHTIDYIREGLRNKNY